MPTSCSPQLVSKPGTQETQRPDPASPELQSQHPIPREIKLPFRTSNPAVPRGWRLPRATGPQSHSLDLRLVAASGFEDFCALSPSWANVLDEPLRSVLPGHSPGARRPFIVVASGSPASSRSARGHADGFRSFEFRACPVEVRFKNY